MPPQEDGSKLLSQVKLAFLRLFGALFVRVWLTPASGTAVPSAQSSVVQGFPSSPRST